MPVILSLSSALVYAVAALLIKLAMSRGASSWSVTFYSNLTLGLIFLPLLAFGHSAWHSGEIWWALGSGMLFFAGQIATFRAISSGDVSIATPALASKVVFVALLSLAAGAHPEARLWAAVGLTMAGMLLLNRGPRAARASHPLITLGWSIIAALVFAAADVLVQIGAPRAGFTLFMPVMFGTVALVSLPLLLPHLPRGVEARPRPGAWRWGAAGIALLALQTMPVAVAIGVYGNATAVNVVYGSRGLWSVIIVALVARQFGVSEGTRDKRTLLFRLGGSILILAAVIVVVA